MKELFHLLLSFKRKLLNFFIIKKVFDILIKTFVSFHKIYSNA